MAIVEEYMIGNTTIKIADDYYKDRTDAEIQAILDRIAANAIRQLNRPKKVNKTAP